MKNKKLHSYFIVLISLFLAMATVRAEDTEIYFSGDIVKPNIMFVLDASGSMELDVPGDTRDRMTVMQDSLDLVLSGASPLLNIGISNFSGHETDEFVNGVTFPVSPIDDPALPILSANMLPSSLKVPGYEYRGMFSMDEDNIDEPADATQTVREFLKIIARGWETEGFTPIADSLYEVSRYYRGEDIDWGLHVPEPDGELDDRRASHPATYTGQYYKRRTVTPGADCSTRTCTDGHNCPPSKTNCGPGIAYCWSNGCGSNCQHFSGSYNETYCTNWVHDPEAGDTCTSWGTRLKTYDYWRCENPVTYCEYEECKDLKGPWEQLGSTPSYNSPIAEYCQNNYMVLLSDGGPDLRDRSTSDKVHAKNKIKSMTGGGACKTVAWHFSQDPELASYPTTALLEDGACGAELTEYMATEDQVDDAILPEDQTVGTYTIGFGLTPGSSEEGYLKLLAKKGLGEYFSANDANSLVDAFNNILSQIGSTASSFSNPVYVVDEQSLFSHEEEVYLPLFDKSNFPRWSGNLKKFKLKNVAGSQTIVGKDGSLTVGTVAAEIPALDELGQFDERVSDYWSTTKEDGENVKAGGVANLLDPATRKLFSNLTGSTNVALNQAANRINTTNIDYTMLGLASNDSAYIDKLIAFIQGYNDDGDPAAIPPVPATPRYHMGDIVHSRPVLVSYKPDGSERTLYVATNEGYLHAFDADTGQEHFAFMPKDLLKNIEKQYKNDEVGTHVQGLDAEITVWRHDENKDGLIDKADGDYVYLYFGMRRGGKNYYALDVTDKTAPKLLWKIEGGASSALGDFSQLGQSWSKPALTKIYSNKTGEEGKKIDVLVFGGGYDPALDEEDPTVRSADTMGKAVFIVNAETGELIWKLDTGLFQHSIPSNIRTLDMDKNGVIDRLYFGDTGGNIWRVDLDICIRNGGTDGCSSVYDLNKAKLTQFAALGGAGSDKRKFFNEPDVSLVKSGGKSHLLISIGSGYRSHPLNNSIIDRFYVIADKNTHKLPEASDPVLADLDLKDYTTLSGNNFLTEGYQGWFIELAAGEKVLADSLTFLGKITFTTFKAESTTSDPCAAPPSSSRAYIMNILTAENALDLNADGVFDNHSADDRSLIVASNEIVNTPQLVFNKPAASTGGACAEGDCSHWVDIRVGKKVTPLADRDNVVLPNNSMVNTLDIGDYLPRSFWIDRDVLQ